MPVILNLDDKDDWLNPQLSLEDAQSLLVPFPDDLLTAYEISTRVNSPRYNSPDAMQPISHD
jgi:putative SOS response-associated peptidase YedK